MQKIQIADTTLCRTDSDFTFKEKIEIARQLEKLGVDIIELPEIKAAKTDILLIRTMNSLIRSCTISVAAGSNRESIKNAAAALSNAEIPRIRIELPVSPVCMEYQCHMKSDKMLSWIAEAVKLAGDLLKEEGRIGGSVEFSAIDATRAEKDFLEKAISTAIGAGADRISFIDSTGAMMPDNFASLVSKLMEDTGVSLAVGCDNKNDLAVAQAILAVRKGACCVKTAVGGTTVPLENFAFMIKNCGNDYGFSTGIQYTQLHRGIKQISWITDPQRNNQRATAVTGKEEIAIHLDSSDDMESVAGVVRKLGYDLSDDDMGKVYEEFHRVALQKKIGIKELDAIISSVAFQVPATYTLESYVINSGNIITSSAQVTLKKGERILQEISLGDGPIDAAFRTIEQCVGHHYDLDDFQIRSITEGQEAVGSCIVRLRGSNKVYSGSGISTDIIGASIRAYISALNKIVYEEA